jgi:hypothetical protein
MTVTYTGLDWAVFIAYGFLLLISGWHCISAKIIIAAIIHFFTINPPTRN